MLQLTHGHSRRGLRRRGTLEALEALRAQGIITHRDHRLLADGYLFLRKLDHRLRLERSQSVDILEREPEKLTGVARALGFKSKGDQDPGALLLEEYARRRDNIRACYDRFFKTQRD
jgi:glutamate-ammonia-ligase adenylyltransferase